MAVAAVAAASASAAGLSRERFGVNVQIRFPAPTDLSVGYSAGMGVARKQVIQGSSSTDQVVTLLAEAHLRLAPFLGLPCPGGGSSCPASSSESSAQAAYDMAHFVTAFAQRYGPGGAFWKQNSTLPYLPVETYEIGNEPNIPLVWVKDSTHLHWSNPADYAAVYEAARAALHAADPSGVAVVGGLADSGPNGAGVDLPHDEKWLAAITGGVDAVAFHPYTWQTSNGLPLMRSDVTALRQWMNAHGLGNSTIEINEFGACDIANTEGCEPLMSPSEWGAFAAGYTTWALCTPGLGVERVDPFYWGDIPQSGTSTDPAGTSSDPLIPLVTSNGVLTAYGQDYLSTVRSLTTSGCPASSGGSGRPGSSGQPRGNQSSGHHRPTAHLQLLHIYIHRTHVTVVVLVSRGSRGVKVRATKGHRRTRLHITKRRRRGTLLMLKAKLARGRWTITVSCTPPPGYAAPPRLRRTVRITR